MKTHQTRIQQILCSAVGCAVLTALITTGCSSAVPEGPSYAEALSIYNEEVRALDRLKEQRDTLQLELDRPPVAGVLDAAEQLLGNTTDLSKQLSGTLQDLAGPDSKLGGEEAQKNQDKLVGSVKEQIKQAKAKEQQKAQQWEARKKELTAKIAELDKQITAQQQRVERALADKNAAEAARR